MGQRRQEALAQLQCLAQSEEQIRLEVAGLSAGGQAAEAVADRVGKLLATKRKALEDAAQSR